MSQNVVNSYRHVASCTQEYRDNGSHTGTGWGANSGQIWACPTDQTIAEGDKIEKIGMSIANTANQPYGVKFVAYADTGGLPSDFICMTASDSSMSGLGWKELDVVNSAGNVEAHTITSGEAGILWLGLWADGSSQPYFDIGATTQAHNMTWNASNTSAGLPIDPWVTNVTYGAQAMTRATVCVY